MMQMHRKMYEYLRYIKYCRYICGGFVGLDNKLFNLESHKDIRSNITILLISSSFVRYDRDT